MFDDFMSGMSWSLPSFDLGLGGFDLSSLTGFGKNIATPAPDIAASASAALPGAAGSIATPTPAPVTDYSTSFKGWGGQQNPVTMPNAAAAVADKGGIFGNIADAAKIFGPFVQGYMGMQQLAAYKKAYQKELEDRRKWMEYLKQQYQFGLAETKNARETSPDKDKFEGLYNSDAYKRVA